MPQIPVTNDALYDYVLIVVLVIIGCGIALKGGKAWGWVLVILAAVWGVKLTQLVTGL